MSTLDEFDKLRKYISNPEGRKLMSKVRKTIKNDKDFSQRLWYFYVNSMDGGEPEELAKEYDLI